MNSLNYKQALESGADAFWVKHQRGEWKKAEYWEPHKLRGNNLHPEVVDFEFLPVFIPTAEQILGAVETEVTVAEEYNDGDPYTTEVILTPVGFQVGDKVIIFKKAKTQ